MSGTNNSNEPSASLNLKLFTSFNELISPNLNEKHTTTRPSQFNKEKLVSIEGSCKTYLNSPLAK